MTLHIATLSGPHAKEPPGNEARPCADTSLCEETNTQLGCGAPVMVVAAVVGFPLPALSYSSMLHCPMFQYFRSPLLLQT